MSTVRRLCAMGAYKVTGTLVALACSRAAVSWLPYADRFVHSPNTLLTFWLVEPTIQALKVLTLRILSSSILHAAHDNADP